GAARHAATVSIASEHGATLRGRDGLLGAWDRAGVGSGGWFGWTRVGGRGFDAGSDDVLSPALGVHVGVVRPLRRRGALAAVQLGSAVARSALGISARDTIDARVFIGCARRGSAGQELAEVLHV